LLKRHLVNARFLAFVLGLLSVACAAPLESQKPNHPVARTPVVSPRRPLVRAPSQAENILPRKLPRVRLADYQSAKVAGGVESETISGLERTLRVVLKPTDGTLTRFVRDAQLPTELPVIFRLSLDDNESTDPRVPLGFELSQKARFLDGCVVSVFYAELNPTSVTLDIKAAGKSCDRVSTELMQHFEAVVNVPAVDGDLRFLKLTTSSGI
jgi:hypothetical protein